MAILPNSPAYLDTPTYDGSGQVVHPSLIDFWFEFGLPSWGGYRFWMGIIPYPDGNDVYENPSLLVSQDGLHWSFPSGINNPLDKKPGTRYSYPANYNSDPDMIYRSTFTLKCIGNSYYYHVWYSASSGRGQWHLGYIEGYF